MEPEPGKPCLRSAERFRLRKHQVLLLALLVVGTLLTLTLTGLTAFDHDEMVDFNVYYSQILAFRSDPETLYAWTDREYGNEFGMPYLYPPGSTLFLGPVTLLPHATAETVWRGVIVAAGALACLLTLLCVNTVYRGRKFYSLAVIIALALSVIGADLMLGQVNGIIAALVAGAVLAHLRGKPGLAAFLAMLGGGIKLFPFALVPLFVWWAGPGRRMRAMAIASLGGVIILFGALPWVIPTKGTNAPVEVLRLNRDYVTKALLGTATGADYERIGPTDAQNLSVPAASTRLAEKLTNRLSNDELSLSQRRNVRRASLGLGVLVFMGMLAACLCVRRDTHKQAALASMLVPLANAFHATTFLHHLMTLIPVVVAAAVIAARRKWPTAPLLYGCAMVCGVALGWWLWAQGWYIPILSGMADRGMSTMILVGTLLAVYLLVIRSRPRVCFAANQ